jgi:hypothetical protein
MSNDNFCFVCYEFKINKERKPKELIKQKLYIKTCECNGLIHNECLKTWYETSGKCPICREFMISKNKIVALIVNINENQTAVIAQPVNHGTINHGISNHGIRMRVYCYIQRNWTKIASYINILFLLLISASFYNAIYTKKHADMI